jgi:hypothetical protein
LWIQIIRNTYTVEQIYSKELTLNNANITSDKSIFGLDISLNKGKFNMYIYDIRDDFTFPFVNFPFSFDGDLPLASSNGIYISQLVRLLTVYQYLFIHIIHVQMYIQNSVFPRNSVFFKAW